MAGQPGTAGRPILSSEHVLFLDYSVDLDWHLVCFQHDSTRDSSIRLGECSRPALVLRHRDLPVYEPRIKRSWLRALCFNVLCTLRRCPSSNRFTIHDRIWVFQLIHPEWCSWTCRLEHLAGDNQTTWQRMEQCYQLVARVRLEPSIRLAELWYWGMGESLGNFTQLAGH